MSNEVAKAPDFSAIERVLVKGDLKVLSDVQKVQYYNAVCASLGLNPLTNPFAYMTLNGKEVLYAKKDTTDQLRKLHKVSVKVIAREQIGDTYIVTAQARLPDGREDESTGAVNLASLKGVDLANAFMKAETKAKRRVTLSICGLGLLDEVEAEDIPEREKSAVFPEQPLEGDGVPLDTGYRIPFGKFAKRSIEEIDVQQLRNYVEFLEDSSAKKGQPLTGQVKDFVERASSYLVALEEQPLYDDQEETA